MYISTQAIELNLLKNLPRNNIDHWASIQLDLSDHRAKRDEHCQTSDIYNDWNNMAETESNIEREMGECKRACM